MLIITDGVEKFKCFFAAKNRHPLAAGADFCLSHVLDHHAAVGFYAGGVGGDVLHVLKRGVDHVALVGVHGLQSGAAAGF